MASELSERIRSILADAEGAAAALRHQADQDAQARLRDAETESLKIVEDARREAERFLADRIERVSALSDEILERGQSVVERLDSAEEVRSQLADLVVSLGETAARLANEVRAMPGPRTVTLGREPARRDWSEPDPPAAGPETVVEPEPEPIPEALVEAEPEPLPEPIAKAEPEAPEAPEPEAMADEAGDTSEPSADADVDRGPALEPRTIRLADEPVAEEPEAEEPAAEAPPAEPTPEERELLEQVRAAEREREGDVEEDEDDATDEPVAEGPSSDSNGDQPAVEEPEADAELVEVHAGEPADSDSASTSPPDRALGARLVALQMAVAGGNRGEVEAHLRRAFELDAPESILDDIFGSGTDPDKRVAWPEVG
jgi:hypothetical protein